jgi:hypothetical protein
MRISRDVEGYLPTSNPLPTRKIEPKVTFNSHSCAEKTKKLIEPLTHNSKKLYLLKQTISAGDGSSRNRALAGSCR